MVDGHCIIVRLLLHAPPQLGGQWSGQNFWRIGQFELKIYIRVILGDCGFKI